MFLGTLRAFSALLSPPTALSQGGPSQMIPWMFFGGEMLVMLTPALFESRGAL